LLYRLPGDAFNAYHICLGKEQAVLVSLSRPVDGIPFGTPLRRFGDTGLFIPLRSRFVPDLPWAILKPALAVQDGSYTFLTQDYRLDLSKNNFKPLSRALLADTGRPHVELNIRKSSTLPPLRWTSPPRPKREKTVQQEESRIQQPSAISFNSAVPEMNTQTQVQIKKETAQFDSEMFWREQAKDYETQGDYLAAAVCYSFLEDSANAARCYRHAAVPE
jgi:hypothetical protein